MVQFANCHNHSLFSDGVYTPWQLAEIAKREGHGAFVLTDHDTVRGYPEMKRAADAHGLLTMLGCEFTTREWGKCIHIVGFDFDPEQKDMRELLTYGAQKQFKRTEFMFRYALEHGTVKAGVTWQEVLDAFPDNDYICNNQIFELYLAKGLYTLADYDDFCKLNFSYSLESSKMAKAQCNMPSPATADVIEIIGRAGGVPVIAHPCDPDLRESADELYKMGAKGFEVIYPQMSAEQIAFFNAFCDEHRLYKCGGTDHSGILGGYIDRCPNDPDYVIDPASGGMTEENFMKLYRRELG